VVLSLQVVLLLCLWQVVVSVRALLLLCSV
jgi:hypothetical protein